jgi:hypothetical protein
MDLGVRKGCVEGGGWILTPGGGGGYQSEIARNAVPKN